MVRKKRLPAFKSKTSSIEYRLDFGNCCVYIQCYQSGLYVVCRGFQPKRCEYLSDKYVFQCSSVNEAYFLFRDLCCEVMFNV